MVATMSSDVAAGEIVERDRRRLVRGWSRQIRRDGLTDPKSNRDHRNSRITHVRPQH